MADPADEGGFEAEVRRPALDPAVYNAVFVRLVVAALFFFVLIFVAAYFTVAPLGHNTPRAVVPVLGAYMDRGAAGDVLGAHALYSAAAIRTVRPEDVAADLAVRRHFEGYQRLQATTVDIVPATSDGDVDRAAVEAIVIYDQPPQGALRARLVYEQDEWRISALAITRGGS